MLLVTVVAQFTAKMTNSEKAIYFLSFMSYSINKLKSHMFFTCKSFVYSGFTFYGRGVGENGDQKKIVF